LDTLLPANTYSLPVPQEKLERIDRNSSPAHFGKLRNAVDFVAPVGTPVLAAADGMVTFVRDDSQTGGASVEYWHDTNFVIISHSNGEFSRYDHLQYKSAPVSVGQHVGRGERIGSVGMTGFTYLPHLHFQVFVITGPDFWNDFDTLPVPDF
jgi:murein DD-endopeptidase MepM/ murein hydrolase activator NlpD